MQTNTATCTERYGIRNSMKLVCTYFDSNFLARGMALIESLDLDSETELAVLALDSKVAEALKALEREDVIIVSVADLNLGRKDFDSEKEFLFSLTADLCQYCRAVLRPHADLLYLDADIKFFMSVTNVFSQCSSSSVAFTTHRHPGVLARRYAKYGKFNVGVNYFSSSAEGSNAIRLWRDRCRDAIQNDVRPTGLSFFSDQVFLDDFPHLFPNFREISEISINAAPWNVIKYRVHWGRDGRLCVNDSQLVCYHFSNLKYLGDNLWDCSASGAIFYMTPGIRRMYKSYISEVSSDERILELKVPVRSVKTLLITAIKKISGLYLRVD